MFKEWAKIEYVTEITRAKAEEYLAHVREVEKQQGKSVKDKFHAISGFLNWALDRKYITENPIQGMKVKTPGRKAVEILPARQVSKLIENANLHEAAILGLAAYAGMRREEICDLLWSEVDLVARWITIYNRDDRETKTSVNRHAPILDQLLPILERLKRPKNGKDGRVFAKFADHKDTFSEVGPLQILRHTAITSWIRSGVSAGTAAEWAGNSPAIIEKNYRARQCPDPIRFTFMGKPLEPYGVRSIQK